MESRVFVTARRFRELQGTTLSPLEELQPLDVTARVPASPN
jgi:hypothetical protein